MAKVRFFVITVEVLVEYITPNDIDNASSKHHTCTFATKNRLTDTVLRPVRFIITVQVCKSVTSEKASADIQCAVAAGQDHFALNDPHLGMIDQVTTEHRDKIPVGDHVVIHDQYEFAATV